MDAVAARTFFARIGDFERIDRMTMAAEARRNAALHELDRHRASRHERRALSRRKFAIPDFDHAR